MACNYPRNCDYPRCECMHSPEDCPFQEEKIKTVDLNRRPALKEELEKDGSYVQYI